MALAKKDLLRVIDANTNRSKEGLRVCEDICRFVLDQRGLTRKFKNVRHLITDAVIQLGYESVVLARNIKEDVGTGTTKPELKRSNISDIFLANVQRVKESVRVLEEFSKLIKPDVAILFKKVRYTIYALEQEAIKKL